MIDSDWYFADVPYDLQFHIFSFLSVIDMVEVTSLNLGLNDRISEAISTRYTDPRVGCVALLSVLLGCCCCCCCSSVDFLFNFQHHHHHYHHHRSCTYASLSPPPPSLSLLLPLLSPFLENLHSFSPPPPSSPVCCSHPLFSPFSFLFEFGAWPETFPRRVLLRVLNKTEYPDAKNLFELFLWSSAQGLSPFIEKSIESMYSFFYFSATCACAFFLLLLLLLLLLRACALSLFDSCSLVRHIFISISTVP
jgi:hypothetical protein